MAPASQVSPTARTCQRRRREPIGRYASPPEVTPGETTAPDHPIAPAALHTTPGGRRLPGQRPRPQMNHPMPTLLAWACLLLSSGVHATTFLFPEGGENWLAGKLRPGVRRPGYPLLGGHYPRGVRPRAIAMAPMPRGLAHGTPDSCQKNGRAL